MGVKFGEVYALDSTIIHTPENYPGAGKTSRKGKRELSSAVLLLKFGDSSFLSSTI